MSDTQLQQDEKVTAAIAHGSAVLFGMGIIAAVVLWATQKEKSRYVAFQALQALVYQAVGLLVQLVAWCCWLALYTVSFIPLLATAETSSEPPLFFLVSMALMFVPLILMGLWILGGLWGAVRTLQGRDFKYAILGNWLEKQG